MPSSRVVSFRAKPEMEAELAKRIESRESEPNPEIDGLINITRPQNINQVVVRDLERYYIALNYNRPRFPLNEAMLIMDAMNGCLFQSEMPDSVRLNILDAIEMDGLDKKWEVDRAAFMERLKSLSSFELIAIADAVEQGWSSEGYHIDNLEEKIVKIGLAFPPQEPTREDRLRKLAKDHGYSSIDEYISLLEESGEHTK
jgi:hypothetical protein